MGSEVNEFDQEVWDPSDAHCDSLVERANSLKFFQDERSKEFLLKTGSRKIVHTSADDGVWYVMFSILYAIHTMRLRHIAYINQCNGHVSITHMLKLVQE